MKSLLARLLTIVAIAVMPALAFQAYSESQARQTRQQMLEEEALRLVRLVAAEQQRIVESAEQMLAVLSQDPAIRGNVGDLCHRFLSGLKEATGRYGTVTVIGLDGHPLCAPIPYDPGTNLGDRSYFKRALETGGFVVGEYVIGRVSVQPTIHFARPFRALDGTNAGVVGAALSLAWLGEQLKLLPLPPDATATVADRNGTILAHYPDGARFVGQKIPARNMHLASDPAPAVTMIEAIDGRRRVLAYIPAAYGPGGLFVSVGLNPDITLGPLAQANRIGITLILAGAAFALALTALLGKRLIRRPVEQLLFAADRWGSGDLSARTGLRHDGSEFGRLSRAFDSMAAALQARTKAMCTALESTTDAVIVLDRDWRITYLNRNAEAHLGRRADVSGRKIWTAIPDACDGAFANACRTAMASRVAVQSDVHFAPSDSLLEIHACPSDDGITVFCRDVTEPRRATAALRASEERLRMAIEAARLGVRDFDLATDTVIWTPEAERIFGREFVASQTFESAIARIHPDDQDLARNALERALSGPGNDYQIEYRIRGSDGAWRWICAYGHVVFEAGTAKRAIAVMQDISVRKQIEADLLRATALISSIGSSSVDAIYAKDLEGRYLYANPAVLAIIGKGADVVIGHTDADWHSDREQAAAVMANDQRIIQTGIAEVFEETYDAAGAGKRVFRSAKSPLRLENGAVIGVAAVSSDITRLKDAEAELRITGNELETRVRQEVAAREAAQARAAHAERMQALGQLAGGIAHDFNNVLQAVSGAMALMERRPEDAAGNCRLARLAGEATERGASITRRLLAFGRLGDLRAEAIEAGQLLPDLQEILVHTLGAGIDVRVRVDRGLRPFVADKSQLETSLINLATNARDAMPRGGRLTISASSEVVLRHSPGQAGGLDPGRYVRLMVADTGSGMDAPTLARSSEPFFTTKAPGAGSGLGLSMAKGFAEQSGGGLSVESAPGLGTTVTLWLPETMAQPAAGDPAKDHAAPSDAAAPAENSGATQAVRVLLVDDETSVREVLTMQLEDFGFTVLKATGGAEALALLAAGEAVDILVTDLSMPGMDGVALIRAAQERLRGLPAVLLTGYAGDGAALALGGAVTGSFSLLRKPVTAANLVDRLRSLLAARRDRDGASPGPIPVHAPAG